jgi:hypothetical protein
MGVCSNRKKGVRTMSVLIKGMEMPEKCGSCDLFHVESPMHCTVVKGHKTVGAPYGMPRPDWCPLVEIPEPHGDLIDRDALNIGEYEREDDDTGTLEISLGGLLDLYYKVKDAPTVIEAEGSEDDED